MPPRKKAAPTDTDANVTPNPSTTRMVRSSTRLASQATRVVAKSGSKTDGATSSKPTSKPASKARSKRTKADTVDDEDDTPASKKPKTAVVDEEEIMDVNAQDDKKADKKMVRYAHTALVVPPS